MYILEAFKRTENVNLQSRLCFLLHSNDNYFSKVDYTCILFLFTHNIYYLYDILVTYISTKYGYIVKFLGTNKS